MRSRRTFVLMLAGLAGACGSADGNGLMSQTAGNPGVSGSGAGGASPIAGAGTGGAAAGAGGSSEAGKATGGGGASAGSAGTAGAPGQRCLQPQDRSGNWTECSNQVLHRATAGSCDTNLPRAQVLMPLNEMDECQQDSDCTAHPHGFCEGRLLPSFAFANACNYGCVSDQDCEANELCVCKAYRPFVADDPGDVVGPNTFDAVIGTCQTSADGCRSDSDCQSGNWCANFVSHCTGTGVSFACQAPADECASSFDCVPGDFCGYENGARKCQRVTCQF